MHRHLSETSWAKPAALRREVTCPHPVRADVIEYLPMWAMIPLAIAAILVLSVGLFMVGAGLGYGISCGLAAMGVL